MKPVILSLLAAIAVSAHAEKPSAYGPFCYNQVVDAITQAATTPVGVVSIAMESEINGAWKEGMTALGLTPQKGFIQEYMVAASKQTFQVYTNIGTCDVLAVKIAKPETVKIEREIYGTEKGSNELNMRCFNEVAEAASKKMAGDATQVFHSKSVGASFRVIMNGDPEAASEFYGVGEELEKELGSKVDMYTVKGRGETFFGTKGQTIDDQIIVYTKTGTCNVLKTARDFSVNALASCYGECPKDSKYDDAVFRKLYRLGGGSN